MTTIVDPPAGLAAPLVHVCADGTAIAYRHISPMDLRAWERAWFKANPEPPIPTQEIDGERVENPGHPDYLLARREWQEAHGVAIIRTLILLGCQVDVDAAAVAAYRALAMEAEPPIPLDPNDRYVYITSLLVIDEVDQQELLQKITGQLAANEEDVKAVIADFQRALPGDDALALAAAIGEDHV